MKKKKKKRAAAQGKPGDERRTLKRPSKYDNLEGVVRAGLAAGTPVAQIAKEHGVPQTYLYPLMRKWGLEPPPLQSRKGIDIRARRAAGDKAFAAVLAGMPVPEAALKFDVEESSIYRRRRDHEKRKALETAKAPPPPAARETSIVPHKPPPPPASVEVMQGRGGRTKAELVQQLLRFTLESDEREPSELERELAETRKERDAAKLALEMVLEKVTGQLR